MFNKKVNTSREWKSTSTGEFNDITVEKNHPLLFNLGDSKTKYPKLLSFHQKYDKNPIVVNLMNQKKNQLSKLWSEVGIGEDHQNEFIQSNFFVSKPHATYKNISVEIMRIFSIKWLEIRLNALIKQREHLLNRLIEICSSPQLSVNKNQIEDTNFSMENEVSIEKTFIQKISEKIKIYRTITLYIIEYINSICTRKEVQSFLWNGEDYLVKMLKDFPTLVKNNKKMKDALAELQLRPSPLCFPENPELYYEYKQKRHVEVDSEKNKEKIKVSNPEKQNLQSLPPNPFFKGDKSFLITEIVDETEKKKKRKLKEKGDVFDSSKLTMKSLHQYINLQPLLILSKYRDKNKRYKKYSELLFSIRHEDLCRKNGFYPFETKNNRAVRMGFGKRKFGFNQPNYSHEIKRIKEAENYLKFHEIKKREKLDF